MNRPMLGDVTNNMVAGMGEDSIYLEPMQEEGVQRRLPGGDSIPRTPVG